MLQLEELLATIQTLKKAGVSIPESLYEKIQKYEIQLLQDELGALFGKYLTQKLQNYIRHEYSITIDYVPGTPTSIKISPKTSGESELVITDIPSSVNATEIEHQDKVTEKTKEIKVNTPPKTNIIKTDIKNIEDPLAARNSFKITFANGDVLHYRDKKKLLVEFARYVGVEKLHGADKELVVTSIHYFRISDSNKEWKYQNVTSDYWIYTDYSLQELLKLFSELNNKMRLGAFVEIVDYHENEILSKISTQEPKTEIEVKLVKDVCKKEPFKVITDKKEGSILKPKVYPIIASNEAKKRNLRIKKYSHCSFVLYGDTSGYDYFLKKLKGAFYKHMPEGTGWVFPQENEAQIKYFIESLDSIPIDKEEYLKVFLKQLSSISTYVRKGIISPHKAILIMTIIQGVDSKLISHKNIKLDDTLISIFCEMWKKYVPSDTPFVMDICEPFINLSLEPFYYLQKKRGYTDVQLKHLEVSWTINSINDMVHYAYIDDQVNDLLNDESCRNKIIRHLITVFKLNDNAIEKRGDSTNQRTKVPSLPKLKILNKYKGAKFKLTYPNGYVEESDAYPDVYIEFVKYAGAKRIREMNIYMLGTNLIVPKEEFNIKYEHGYKDVGGGFYLNTISTTQRKFEIMTFISKQLKLNVKIELVPNNT